MPHKRKKRKQTPSFYCPHCQKQLWRQGSQKHYLVYTDAAEIRQRFGLSRKNASFLAAASGSCTDRSSWIEEFYCRTDGRIWLTITKSTTGNLVASPAQEYHWKRTAHTVNPDRPNPSVSEFTYRASRATTGKLA